VGLAKTRITRLFEAARFLFRQPNKGGTTGKTLVPGKGWAFFVFWMLVTGC